MLCRVTKLDPDRTFDFRVYPVGTRWGCNLTPAEDGVVVTEYREWPKSAVLHRILRVSGAGRHTPGQPRSERAYRSLERIKKLCGA